MPIAKLTEVIPYITGWLSDILIVNLVKLLNSGASVLVILREGKIFEKYKSYPNLNPKVKINIDKFRALIPSLLLRVNPHVEIQYASLNALALLKSNNLKVVILYSI